MSAKCLPLSLLVLLLVACQSGEPDPGSASGPAPAKKEGVVKYPLRHFQAERLRRFMDRELPDAIAQRDDGSVRRICDLGQETIRQLEKPPELTPELEAIIPRFQRYCAVDVSLKLLAATVEEISALDEADRQTRCDQSAALTVTFSLKHDIGDPQVEAERDRLLALCPQLAEGLAAFEKKRREHEQKNSARDPDDGQGAPDDDAPDSPDGGDLDAPGDGGEETPDGGDSAPTEATPGDGADAPAEDATEAPSEPE